jgi:hypothetical protein
MDNKVLRQVLESAGSNLVNRIVKILGSDDKVASGKLINSIEYVIGEKEGELFIELLMEDYWIYINNGSWQKAIAGIGGDKKRRKEVFRRLSGHLIEWGRLKNVNPFMAANAIIKKGGIKGIFFLEEAVKNIEEEFAESLEKKWGSELGKELEEQLKRSFQTR